MRKLALCLIGMVLLSGCRELSAPSLVPAQISLWNTSLDAVDAKVSTATGIRTIRLEPGGVKRTLRVEIGTHGSAEVTVAFWNASRGLTEPDHLRVRTAEEVQCTYKVGGTATNPTHRTDCR